MIREFIFAGKDDFYIFESMGSGIALVLISILFWIYMAMTGKTKEVKNERFFRYVTITGIIFCLLVFPGVMFVLKRIMPGYDTSNTFFFIPSIIVGSVTFISVYERYFHEKKERIIFTGLFGLLVLCSLSVPTNFTFNNIEIFPNTMKISNDVIEIAEYTKGESVSVPQSVYGQIEEFTHDVQDVIQYDKATERSSTAIIEFAAEKETRYVILVNKYRNDRLMVLYNYHLPKQFGKYVCYTRSDIELESE